MKTQNQLICKFKEDHSNLELNKREFQEQKTTQTN